MHSFLTVLAHELPGVRILENEPLSRHTSFRIGGPARALLCPKTVADIPSILRIAAECGVKLYIMGNGTNLLVSDAGINAFVLKTVPACANISIDNGLLTAESGCTLARAAVEAQKAALSGFEFAHGIPGSVGGAVAMNAGAYGGEISQVLVQTTYCSGDGTVHVLDAANHDFGYRHSFFTDHPDCIVLSSCFRLHEGARAEIRKRMDDLALKRSGSQPLDKPSAGSVFKRPVGHYAGRLIEDCGLKGFTIGGAQVSPKHAGFIINNGGATCDDVRCLIEHIQHTVMDRFRIQLECEVRYWGE